MLMTYGLAFTLCCRGLEIKEAFLAIFTASVSDKDLFTQRYNDLVTEKKTLLAMKDKLLAGGQGPRLASTPTPLISAAHHPACNTTAAAQHLPA